MRECDCCFLGKLEVPEHFAVFLLNGDDDFSIFMDFVFILCLELLAIKVFFKVSFLIGMPNVKKLPKTVYKILFFCNLAVKFVNFIYFKITMGNLRFLYEKTMHTSVKIC